MCKLNVNINARFYDGVKIENSSNTYINQFNRIECKFEEETNSKYIGPFYIVTDTTMLETQKEDRKSINLLNNIIENNLKVKLRIRITKLNKDPEKQYKWDVDSFEIEKDMCQINRACVHFLNHTRITKINRLELNSDDYAGNYVVKVLIEEENNLIVQSMTYLNVFENTNPIVNDDNN